MNKVIDFVNGGFNEHILVSSEIWPEAPIREVEVRVLTELGNMEDHGYAEVLIRIDPARWQVSTTVQATEIDWFVRIVANGEWAFELFADGRHLISETFETDLD